MLGGDAGVVGVKTLHVRELVVAVAVGFGVVARGRAPGGRVDPVLSEIR